MTVAKKFLCVFLSTFLAVSALSLCVIAEEERFVDEIDILIRPKNFTALTNENNRKVEYPALVSINDSAYSAVTVNTRGNSSFYEGFDSPAKRMPFEISFDNGKYGENKSLKLNGHSSLYKLLAEYTAYKIYEQMGIPAPKATPIFLKFNSVDFGLYLGVEDVNEDFILKNFGQDALKKGALYKPVSSTDGYSKEDCISTDWGTIYCKFGNEHDTLLSFLDAAKRKNGYEKFVDTDSLIRFFACIAGTCNFDSLASFNNFYFFVWDGKITFIPWDPSQSFHGFNAQDGINNSSSFFDLFLKDDANKEKYYSYLEQIRKSFLDPKISTVWVKDLVASLESYCKRDRSVYLSSETSLKNITDGNILIDGNFALALSEVYRQLEEQITGESDVFYIPDSIVSDVRLAYPSDVVFAKGLDAVPIEICNSFSPELYYSSLIQLKELVLIIVLTIPPVILLCYLVISTITIKKKRASSRSESNE